MSKTRKTAVILTLAVAFCVVLIWLVSAGPDDAVTEKEARMPSFFGRIPNWPIWQITQDGTNKSVKWVNHAPNPRFAIYDPGTPEDETDDVVLDKETGLVWERWPSGETMNWYDALYYSYNKCLGGRMGWRLPTIEELASLVDSNEGPPALPSGHPFINVQSSYYWSSTTGANDTAWAYDVNFDGGYVNFGHEKIGTPYFVWCVRGGQGYDGY